MRAIAALSLCKITVHAKKLKVVFRETLLAQAHIDIRAPRSQGSPMAGPCPVNMVNGQKLLVCLATAGTLPTVSLKNLSSQLFSVTIDPFIFATLTPRMFRFSETDSAAHPKLSKRLDGMAAPAFLRYSVHGITNTRHSSMNVSLAGTNSRAVSQSQPPL